jgi:poly-beta-1,6-N-acetyl-D-glucosamine synthase
MYFPEFREAGAPEIFSVLAVAALVTLIVNYFIQYLPLLKLKEKRLVTAPDPVPVSVIICARNEEDNLTEFLPQVLSQDHPDFEVVVVNDCSYDNTENVIDEFIKVFPNLRKTTIKEDAYYKHGKKFAMLVGIKAARHEHMVFTDADCFPAGNTWLSEMSRGFAGGREIVLGYGAYEKSPGLLGKLIRFDSFIIATHFLSAAIRRKPYMGVGRNLGYTKSLFFAHKGFSGHYHLVSGDDDLFVNQTADAENTNVCVSHESITYSRAKRTFRDWRLQKARHLTTAPLYTGKSKSLLLFNYFSQYFFLAALVSLAFSMNTLLLIPILLALKISAQWLLLRNCAAKLNEKDLWLAAPFYELILLFIYPTFHGTKLFYKPERWTN